VGVHEAICTDPETVRIVAHRVWLTDIDPTSAAARTVSAAHGAVRPAAVTR
jgi:hypothetical protein